MIDIDIFLKTQPNLLLTGKTDQRLFKVETNSKNVNEQSCFIALKGERFDAFDFIEDCLKRGVKLAIYNNQEGRQEQAKKLALKYHALLIGVKDTTKYLQLLSEQHLAQWNENGGQVIGVTGSNGKTTHKEILYQLLDNLLPAQVLCTQGNLNNHLGVPLTLLKLTMKHKLAIIEMGTNHPGEIEFLCNIAKPNYGLITNIGFAHIEFFKKIENIYQEKSALYRSVVNNSDGKGVFVANFDDEFLAKMKHSDGLVSFGKDNGDYKIRFSGDTFVLKNDSEQINFENKNIHEVYNKMNLVACFLLSYKLFPDKLEKLVRIVSDIKLPKNNRSQWLESNNKKVFLDAYNANPSSMKVSLSSFCTQVQTQGAKLAGDCLFILGDMNELGEDSELFHKSIAQFLNQLGVKNALFVGQFAQFYAQSFKGESKCFEDVEKCKIYLTNLPDKFHYLFIKGSRSLQLESLIDIK